MNDNDVITCILLFFSPNLFVVFRDNSGITLGSPPAVSHQKVQLFAFGCRLLTCCLLLLKCLAIKLSMSDV